MMPVNALSMSEEGIQHLQDEEGFVDGLYDDPSKYATFGVGHLVHKDKSPCFLLAAAKSDATLTPLVKKIAGTLAYLDRGVVSNAAFAGLRGKATEQARDAVATRKFAKAYNQLAANDKATVDGLVKAALDEEQRLLGLTVVQVLKSDLGRFEKTVNEVVTVPLKQSEFDALVSFCFNIGQEGFKGSTLLKKINSGQFRSSDANVRAAALDEIEQEFLKWNKSGGKVLPGLTKRRKAEAARFLAPSKQPA